MASSGPPPPNSRDDFEIAIVCALAVEYDAVSLLIDQFWDGDGDRYGRAIGDPNIYTTGRMGRFDIVLVLLSETGNVSAASAASSFRSSYPKITLALLVGTCGGVPYTKDREEILLGDVVVSKTVIQYDLGSQYTGQFQTKETLEDRLGRPGPNIRSIFAVMETNHGGERLVSRAAVLLDQLQRHAGQKQMRKRVKYEYPGIPKDRLYEPSYVHKHQILLPHQCCEKAPCHRSQKLSCDDLGCQNGYLVQRQRLNEQARNFSIFIGRFGSGDTTLKSGLHRDDLAQRHELLAFEMEGAGIWDQLPCIIVKGISNYADGHRNADSDWRHYAAATAAATARALVERYPKTDGPHPSLVVIKERRRRTKEEDECLKDMHVTDPSLDKKRIENTNGGLLKDSYVWILSNADYIRWRDDSDSGLLWIKGDPGKGKTMLLCGLINELQADSATRPYYFFCQASDSRLNSATKVLCSLIYSIACEDEQALSCVMEKYKHAGKELFYDINAWSALSGIMMNILRHTKLKDKVFIIDGLDECVADLLLLLDFIAQAPGLSEAKWVVSSRNWPNIEERLNTSTKRLPLSLELNEQSISDAVQVYITHKLDQLAALKKLDETFRGAVENHLSAHANGTFLWVALVYKELFKEGVKKRHLQDLMTAFPPELGPLYSRMMEQVCKSRDKEICIQVLEMISLTYQPISLMELASFVEIPVNDDGLEELKDIVGTCGSFLVLKNDVIYFIHQSAKDFLLNNTPSEIFTSGTAFKHHDIFSRSVQILSRTLRRDMYNLRHPGARPSVLNPDPLATLHYACLYWVDHLQDSSGETIAQASLQDDGPVHSFLKDFLLHWLEAFCLMGKLSEGIIAIKMLEWLTAQDLGLLHMFARDARRFALSFRPAIESTPLQLYSSALLFTPTSSIVRQTFESVHTARWITQKPSVQCEWNACVQKLEGHKDDVWSLVFSPDNTKMASSSRDCNLRLWDRATGACIQSLNPNVADQITSMTFSPDSSQLALAFNNSIKVLDINTSAFTMTHNVGFESWSVMFSLDGLRLIASNKRWDPRLYRIWDLKTGVQLRDTDYYQDVGEPAVSQLAKPGSCYEATIENPRTGSRVRVFSEYHLERVVFTLDGTKLALRHLSGSVPIYILDAATGEPLQVFMAAHGSVYDLAFSPDGTQLATAYSEGDIQIWGVETGACLFTFPTHAQRLYAIAYSPDGTELASSGDQTIRIWDLTLDISVKTEEKPLIWSATYSPDSTRLAFMKLTKKTRDSFTIEIWDAVTGICQQQLRVGSVKSRKLYDSDQDIAYNPDITELAFSTDQTRLAYWTTSYISIWDLAANTIQNVGRFGEWDGNLMQFKRSIGFSPCGIRLALVFKLRKSEYESKAETSKIEIRDVTDGAIVHTFYSTKPILETKFSLDGRHLGSLLTNGSAVIWDLDTGACLQSFGFNLEKIFGRPLITYEEWEWTHFRLERLQRAQVQYFVANILQNQDSLQNYVHEFDLDSNNSWILRRGEPFLWLPAEYRPTDMTFAGDRVAIILAHRELVFFRFNLAQLDAEMASNRSSILEV